MASFKLISLILIAQIPLNCFGRLRCFKCSYGDAPEAPSTDCLNPEDLGGEIITCKSDQVCFKQVSRVLLNSTGEEEEGDNRNSYILLLTRGCSVVMEGQRTNCGAVDLDWEDVNEGKWLGVMSVPVQGWRKARMTTCYCASNLCNNEPGLGTTQFDAQVEFKGGLNGQCPLEALKVVVVLGGFIGVVSF